MAKKKKSLSDVIESTVNSVQKASKTAVSQGKGTATQQKKSNNQKTQNKQKKYQDGQYGQFIKNSRLNQSSAAKRNNSQAQNQNQSSKRKQQKVNKVASTYGELNEQINKKNQQRAKQQSKSAHRLGNATKGTLQQTLGSHATTFYAARNPNEDKYIKAEEYKKNKGEKNTSKFSEGQYGQLLKKERSGNTEERKKNLKKASELIEKGSKNIEKSKEGLGKAGKFGVDTYSAMLGMATDAVAGPFSMGSMASRSFGGAYDTAKKEGANDSQAALYGASQAAVETATEKMFAVAKPLRKLYGAGAGDDIAEKLAEKMASKASSKAGKEAAYHGGKTAMAALTEGLEEMVSEGLEPALANQIYANATGTPHSTSAKDVLYAGAVGGAMGGILGGGGQAVEYNQGQKIQNVYGEDGLKTMAKKLRDVADEATDGAAIGELTNKTIDEGQPVTSVQAKRLYAAAAQQEEADYKRQSAMDTVAANEISKKNYLNPVARDEQGNVLAGENTQKRYAETVQNTVKQINESEMNKGLEMPDSQVEQIASAISAIQTGLAGTNEVNMFLAANPKARTVYEVVTGEKLPAGNTETKETLYGMIAANRVESAKLETQAFADRVKGGMVQDVAKTYDFAGQTAFEQMMDGADITNAAQTQNDIVAFEDYYRAGKNGISYETVASMNNPAHQAARSTVNKAAWEAGREDAALAADTAKGLQIEIGKRISKSRSNGKSKANKGKVAYEVSQEAKRNIPASEQRMYRQLARVLNVNIHIVDNEDFNGMYDDGEVYLSVNADRGLAYVFAHEITHHMQDYAPVEYNELKELIRKRWAEKGGIDEAVGKKTAQYEAKGKKLTYEEALDEIIADSTYEMIQDENFAQQLCAENRNLAQKLLDAIKSVLSKLRQVLAEGDGFTPAQNAALLSELDVLKEAEKLWTDGLVKAAENRDAVGVDAAKTQVVKISAKDGKKDSIRLQIEANLDKINKIKPVADVKTKGYKGKSDKQIIDAVMSNYKKRGYGVDRKGFGFISLEEELINRSLNYLNTEAEYAAFDVLPQVLKNGMEIRDEEHKGRGYNTVTFAAPVVINEKRGIVGAVVAKTKGNRYKTHRILMPDGSQYIFENEKAEATTSGMTEEKINGEGPDITSAVDNSISQTNQKDNEKSHSFKGIDGENVKYSIREDDPPKKTVKGYKVFVVKNGKLYPPMVANPGGADTPVGVWLDADEGVRAGESKTGRPQVKAGGKGTQGGSGKLAYRPGWHLGEIPMATQFARMNKETGEKELFPENFVWAECEVAADHDYQDEAMSYGYSENGKFRHAYAGLPRIPKDGMYRYRTNPDPSTVPWIISGSMKVTKVLSDAEVDEVLRSNATVSETAPEDKNKLWVDSSDGGTLKYWYGSKKEWRKAPVVRKGGEKTLEELGISSEKEIGTARFSMKEPVEEQGNLIAVHNIKAAELLKTIRLGGFPMPSIAVTKAEMGHTMYGAVSVLFSKDAIDPKASRYNKVYSGDAYTPEFPRVDYEVDSKKSEQLKKHIENIIGDDLKGSSMRPYLDSNNLEDKINRQSGDFVEAYMNNEAMMYAFMKEREGSVELPQEEVLFSHGGKYTNEQVKKFAEIFPENELNDIYALGGPEISEYYERNPEKIELVREARNRDFREKHKGYAERYAKENGTELEYYKEVDFADFDNLLLSLLRYYEKGDTSKLDTAALSKTVRAYADEHNNEYLKWLADISNGVVAGSGIRNEKDMFTSGLRRRSFKALHDDVNLENVVKAMRRDAQTGSGFGGYSFIGSATREYGSVDDIKSDTDRLRLEDMKTYNEHIDDIKSGVAEIAERLAGANPYISVHDIESCIAEAAAKRKTKSGIKNFLEKELDIPADENVDTIAAEILNLKGRAQKLPTGYFEAKPQRAIAFDEVKAVIAPDNIDTELKSAIEDAGMDLYEYKADDDEDRLAKVNEAAEHKNAKFSLKESFEEQVEGALSGKLDRNNHVYVCETPQILKDVGLDDLPMLMTQKHIRNINKKENGAKKRNHGIGKKIIKKIPQYLQSPAAIMDSLPTATQPGVVVLTEEVDSKGRPIIIAIKPNGQGFYSVQMRSNFILSMYGRNDFALFWDKNIQEKTFLYIDSKKSKALSEEVQLQLLQSVKGFALDTIIRKSKNVVNEKAGKKYSLSDEPAEERIKTLEKRIDELQEDVKAFRDKGWYLISSGDLQETKPEDFIGQKVYSRATGEERTIDKEFIDRVKDVQEKSREADRLIDEIIKLEEQTSAEKTDSIPDEESIMDYAAEHETEFVDVPPVRDYERKARGKRVQTVDELRAQVEKLQADKKLTKGMIFDKRAAKEQINDMVVMMKLYAVADGKKTDARLVSQATENISTIYTLIKEGDYAGAVNQAYYAAEDMVDGIDFIDDSMFTEYRDLRNEMRTTKITISERDAADIPDFKDWKKSQFGKLRIAKNGIPVDSFYESLCEEYPEWFDYGITHPADQLQAIAEVRDSLEPFDVMLESEEYEDLVKQTAQDMIDIAATGKPWKSWADRKQENYDARIKRLKQRQQEALRDVRKKAAESKKKAVQKTRDKKNEQIKNIREKAAESKKKAVQKVREKKDEQIETVREKGWERLRDEREKQKAKEEKRKAGEKRKERFARIEKNHKWLSDRLLKPTDDKHIPEEFKAAVAHLLCQIDLQTERSKNLEVKYGKAKKTIQMDDFRRRYAELAKEDGSGMFEYDGYVFELIDSLAEKLNGRSIDECSDADIAEFDILLKAIRHNIQNYNKAFSESLNEKISGIAEEAIAASEKEMSRRGGKRTDRSGAAGTINSLLNESMVAPRDFFEQIGGGMNKVFGALRKGFDRHVDNITSAREFFDGIFSPYNRKGKPGSAIEKWRDDSQAKEFEVYGGKIKLNPAQIMSLYCLSKREQALGHILGGGIVASRVDAASKIKQALGAKIETRGSSVMVTQEDIIKITASLTAEQREMADKLQDYLNNECAELGNETSMRLYGYRKFTEENYFPIKSSDAYLDSNIEGRNAQERIRNFGFTKGAIVNANNPIMIDDIFTVTADHINKMSLYNAFAAPISDFMRVYNYKARNEDGQLEASVKAKLEDAYGKGAINYINNFMSDVNNQVQMRTEGLARFISKSLANYKKATIGFNARVALQQPTAIMRAFMLMNPKYFAGSGSVNVKKNLQEMKEHCQTARWKSWGFSQVDMARDIDQIMMNNEWSRMDVLTMQIYGALDNVTWSFIWAAVKKEVKATHPNVKEGSEEFYRLCNDRASEVFDKTQVVDSVFHRSQAMRNTDTMSKMLTSFMAEPTRTYNMMRSEFVKARELWNDGDKKAAVIKMNKACSVFMLNAAAVSAAAAIADVMRGRTPGDDDDDDSYMTNFLSNLWDNINPANMFPIAKDIWGAKDGWSIKNMALSGYESLVQAFGKFADEPSAENARKLAEGFGLVTGLPVKNVLREMESAFGVFGIDVFAAEEGESGLYDKKEDSFLDKLLNSLGLGKTEEQKQEEAFKEEVKTVEEAADGLTGKERKEAIWKAATENYTAYVAEGDMSKISEMRKVLEAAGGDVDKFDKSVQSKVITNYKKNIGSDGDGRVMRKLREYLLDNGYTEAKISQEIIAKSDTAKEFQKALCTGDEDAEYLALAHLLVAGIYDTEIQTLYQNRVRAIDATDYSTGEFVNPVSGTITSGFGYRSSPGGIGSTNHKGIDIAVAEGTDVAAADGGKVTKTDYNSARGYYVEITHGNGRKTRYQHLKGWYVQTGDVVAKGQTIAASGNTGNSTGPHLHFEVMEGSTYVDPMTYLK